MGYTGDSIHPECIGDLQEQINYIGSLDLLIYFNDEKLETNKYGD